MISLEAVSLARARGGINAPWLIGAGLLAVFNYVFPAIQRDLEARIWQQSLSSRPDAILSSYVLDGTLTWIGLTLTFCISSGLFRLAFNELDGRPSSARDLLFGLPRFLEFVEMSFVAVVLQEVLWAALSRRFVGLPAVGLRIAIVGVAITPFIFVVPAMIDRGLSGLHAMRASARAVGKQPLDAFLLMISAGFWANIGLIALFVGVLFTLPTYHRALAAASRKAVPRDHEGES